MSDFLGKQEVLPDHYVATVDYMSPEAAKQFASSLEKTGFAIIKNHPIAKAEMDAVYADMKKFFELKEAEKLVYQVTDRQKQDGYFPFRSENGKGYDYKNLMEYFHYYRWTDKCPPMWSDSIVKMHDRLVSVAVTLLTWLQSELPEDIRAQLSMPLNEMIKDTPRNLLRLIHYPPLQGNEETGAIRTSPHEDIDLLTVLPAATTSGLQALDLQGNWHTVAPDPGMLVINAGDMLQMCTQGYYRSTTHRVVNPTTLGIANQSRYSMPLFCHPRPEVLLSKTCTSEAYLFERLRENGVKED